MKIRPKSKGELNKILTQTAPKLDHKYGYFRETVDAWRETFGIAMEKFWKNYGVNTCVLDRKTWKIVYYDEDICRTFRACFNKKWNHPLEWD